MMIVSHTHKFIFVHCRKTGGSSVAVSLARNLGATDIQVGGVADAWAEGVRPNRACWKRLVTPRATVRFALHIFSGKGLPRALNDAITSSWKPVLGSHPGHASAAQLRDAFPSEWAKYNKFCVVRNPYDRVVSDYYWRLRNVPEDKQPTFARYVAAMAAGDALGGIVHPNFDNWDLYTIDDKVAIDHVVRYESLKTDLERIFSEIGYSWDGWLPRAKAGIRKEAVQDKYSLFTSTEVDTVSRLFAREIDTFKYTFPGTHR